MLARRLAAALAVGLLAAGVAAAVEATGALDRVEADTVDERFEIRGEQPVPPDVVFVAIDDASFRRLGVQWPFSRSLHARVIERLRRAGARTIVYDVQFSEPSSDRAGDRALLRAATADDVILGTVEVDDDGEPAILGGATVLRRGGGRVGNAMLPVDQDGIWRRVGASVQGVPTLTALAAGSWTSGHHPIDFAGSAGRVGRFSFADVVQDLAAPRDLRGKIVVVGASAPALGDIKPTPVGDLPGAEVHANAIQTALDGFPLRDAAPALDWLLLVVAGLVAPLSTLAPRPRTALARPLLAAPLGAAALLVLAQVAFGAGTVIAVVAPQLALALGTLGAVAVTYGTEVRARQRVRRTFERFVPPAIVDEVIASDGGAPRRMEATVLFCDLRGFTGLAERLEAEQVIAVLNRYLDAVSGAVLAHGGTLVSFQGDGVMAVFGAPLAQPDHASRALAAAREIRDVRLPAFNAWLVAERLSVRAMAAGIGINSGAVMSGSVGSARRLEYAAVGDATNVAARLQALSRDAPEQIFVSAATAALLGGSDGLRPHGEVRLAGRTEPVVVYTA